VVSCEDGEEDSAEDDAEEDYGAGGDTVTTGTACTAGLVGDTAAAESSGIGGVGQGDGGGEVEPAPLQEAYEGEEPARVNVEGRERVRKTASKTRRMNWRLRILTCRT
jgi:hypothetical protein